MTHATQWKTPMEQQLKGEETPKGTSTQTLTERYKQERDGYQRTKQSRERRNNYDRAHGLTNMNYWTKIKSIRCNILPRLPSLSLSVIRSYSHFYITPPYVDTYWHGMSNGRWRWHVAMAKRDCERGLVPLNCRQMFNHLQINYNFTSSLESSGY